MIVDTSTILAILRDESEAESFAGAIANARILRISAVNYVEAATLIAGSRDPIASRRFDDFFREASFSMETVIPEPALVAREAYWDFGRCNGHLARLNFGNCLSWALAKAMIEPALFKGQDFKHTDLSSVLA